MNSKLPTTSHRIFIARFIDDGSMGGGEPIPHKWDKFPESEFDKIMNEEGLWSFFTPSRHGIFHYCIFAHYGWKQTSSYHHDGEGEFGDDFFMVFEEGTGNEAKAFMHELGHNILGIDYLNDDDTHRDDKGHCSHSKCVMQSDPCNGDLKYCSDCWDDLDLYYSLL